ncbi:MAG: hypothetical protein ABII18_10830 [bacterium]
MKTNQIIRIISRITILMILLLVTYPMLDCAGPTTFTDDDPGTGPGPGTSENEENDQDNSTTLTKGEVSGIIDSIVYSANEEQLTTQTTICDENMDNVTDSGEEFNIVLDNYTYVNGQADEIPTFRLTLYLEQSEIDIRNFETGIEYTVDVVRSSAYVKENKTSQLTKHSPIDGYVVFSKTGLAENNSSVEYSFELNFENGDYFQGEIDDQLQFSEVVDAY